MNMTGFRVVAFGLASIILCFQGVHFTYFKFSALQQNLWVNLGSGRAPSA
jgi:hypothetical protein